MQTQSREALERLISGNRRFVAERQARRHDTQTRRDEVAAEQEPFAIILGCSDSRVPAEIIFDQGLGDLYVIRVAGNIIAPSLVGSVEFAAAQFGTRLVVILGHSCCGAVQATLEELRRPTENQSPNLAAIVERIRPSVTKLLEEQPNLGADDLIEQAVRDNVCASAHQLRNSSKLLDKLIAEDGLLIVGAEYSLETGFVDFFDGIAIGES